MRVFRVTRETSTLWAVTGIGAVLGCVITLVSTLTSWQPHTSLRYWLYDSPIRHYDTDSMTAQYVTAIRTVWQPNTSLRYGRYDSPIRHYDTDSMTAQYVTTIRTVWQPHTSLRYWQYDSPIRHYDTEVKDSILYSDVTSLHNWCYELYVYRMLRHPDANVVIGYYAKRLCNKMILMRISLCS